jgi:hypothetical protein
MQILWNSLKRGQVYWFTFGHGIPTVFAVFHEIMPDGSLRVANEKGEFFLSPDQIAHVRVGVK